MRILAVLSLWFLTTHCVIGQMILPEHLISKKVGGEILLRWEPSSIDEWNDSAVKGYQVELYRIHSDGSKKVISSKNVRPVGFTKWGQKQYEKNRQFPEMWESAKVYVYPDLVGASILKDLNKALVKKSPQTLDSMRLNFLSYYSIMDKDLAQAVGLSATIRDPGNGSYGVDVYVPGHTIHSTLVLHDNGFVEKPIEIQGEWSDRFCSMSWKTYDNHKKYFGYIVEKSTDQINYKRLNEQPFLDPGVGQEGDKNNSSIMISDSLDMNYKEYYYRIQGMDYFGDLVGTKTIYFGHGFKELSSSPALTMADQMTNNDAYLEWKVNYADIPLIDYFRLLRSDDLDGKYEIVKDSIDVAKRSIKTRMEFETNFFRLESVPKDGIAVSSMPVFIMGMDTIPPAIPVPISAMVDSSGNVEITWEANTEADLGGYRIFRGNFENEEFSLVNGQPTMDTILIDTVSMKLENEKVFYVLQACDRRNNRSAFTEPIIVVKPDIIPPGKPIVNQLIQVNDTLEVHWIESGSADAIKHRLFRRNLDEEGTWTLIAEFDSTNMTNPYLDIGLAYDKKIAYTMFAIDDSDLESKPATMKVKVLEKPKEVFEAFARIDTSMNFEDQKFTIRWECNNAENLKSVLLYRGFDKDKLGKYKYVDVPEMSIEDKIGDAKVVYYSLKPVYKDQTESYYSEIIEVINSTRLE